MTLLGPGGTWWIPGLGLLALAGWVSALEPITLRSRSGQFVVHGIPLGASPAAPSRTLTNSFVRLDPSVMAVSCERIRDAVLAELNISEPWNDTIEIWLRPVRGHDEPINLASTRFRDGWSYHLSLPDHLARAKFVRTLVQVVLLEVAQRQASNPVELPPWLSEGLAAHLESTAMDGLALEPHTSTVIQGKRQEPIGKTRDILRENPPLTIDHLSWPSPLQVAGTDGGLYRACSHLLVRELLRLDNGPEGLRETVGNLSKYLNWQTAFLHGFNRYFRRMVDVEKWWALTTTHFTGVERMSLWTAEQTLAQLDEALIASVQVRPSTNDVPRIERLTLQQMLTQSRPPQREAIIQAKVQLLDVVRLRAAAGLAPMVEAYKTALGDFLKAPSMTYSFKGEPVMPRKLSLPEAITRLDELDRDRAFLRRQLDFNLTEARPE
jgi:hypothetical protein